MGLQEAFNEILERLGPFEDRPHLAVATSGGSDSLALALLAWQWVRRYEGTLTALIVDHGLRPESENEARQTLDLLSSCQIPAIILKWEDAPPKSRIQERAREARYRILLEWCRQHQALHLLLGHHQDDQRETFQLRQQKQSRSLGLSGMSAILETPWVRILRPLLPFPKSCLKAWLTAQHISFIEDPSNINPRYSRASLRQHEVTPQEQKEFVRIIKNQGICRIQEEKDTNKAVSQCVESFPEGYGVLKKDCYRALSTPQQLNVLQRCIMTFGVGPYPPRRESLEKTHENLETTRTLHGCLIFSDQERIFFAREPQKTKNLLLSQNVLNCRWDDRFNISFMFPRDEAYIGSLTEKGWAQIKRTPQGKLLEILPHPVRLGLPAVWKGPRLICLLMPSRDQKRDQTEIISGRQAPDPALQEGYTKKREYGIRFAPRYPLTRFTFTIA